MGGWNYFSKGRLKVNETCEEFNHKKSNEAQLEDFFYQTKKNEIQFYWKINENKFSKKIKNGFEYIFSCKYIFGKNWNCFFILLFRNCDFQFYFQFRFQDSYIFDVVLKWRPNLVRKAC